MYLQTKISVMSRNNLFVLLMIKPLISVTTLLDIRLVWMTMMDKMIVITIFLRSFFHSSEQ